MANLNGHEAGNGGYSQEETCSHYATILLGSPEIIHRVGGLCRSYGSRQNSYSRKGQGDKSPTGSETVSRCQGADMNSGEPEYSQSVSKRQHVSNKKILPKNSFARLQMDK